MRQYIFAKDHPITFKMLRAGLVAMCGESGKRKETVDAVEFKWPGVKLLYHFTSSMAGSSYVSFSHNIPQIENLISKWYHQSEFVINEGSGQIQYVNLKDKSGQSVAYVQFSFAPKGQLSYAGIKHAIGLMIDNKPIERTSEKTLVPDTTESICEWEDADNGTLITLFAHAGTEANSTKCLQLRVHPKCTKIIAMATSFITLQPDDINRPLLARAASK